MRILAPVFALFLVCVTLFATPVQAQEQDDKGFLVEAIQDALSGAGRQVSIDGFRGALSSAASFTRMQIADQDGVWLTLEDVVLDWNRSALLRGRLEVEKLTARRLDLPRLPRTQETELPQAEATPFALPDLPVSIDIAAFAVEEINLGAPILGVGAQLQITAQAVFNDDLAATNILAKRTDGTRGSFALTASFNRAEEAVELLLTLSEEQGGIAGRLLNLPDQPALNMRVVGVGPLDDLVTDIALSSEGAERLAGQVVLKGEGADRRMRADIGGDISALLAPQYRAFFGSDMRLKVDVLQEASGAIQLDDLSLKAQALDITGEIDITDEGWPRLIDLSVQIENPDGGLVVMPISGADTLLRQLVLDVAYDAAKGDAITGALELAELASGAEAVATARLNFDGTLQRAASQRSAFLGDLTFAAQGIALSDPAMAQAVGARITGRTRLAYGEDGPFTLRNLALSGADFGLNGSAVVQGGSSNFQTALDATLRAADLGRFSALAGQDLSGAAALAMKGDVTPLGAMFDLAVQGTTQDLGLGIARVDAVLAGETVLAMLARRDDGGTFLEDVTLSNAALDFVGDVALRSADSRINARAQLSDIAFVLPQYSGPVSITGEAVQTAQGWRVDGVTDGPYGAVLSANGLATGADAALVFAVDVPEVADFVTAVNGPLNAKGTLRNTAEGWQIASDLTAPFDLSARLDGIVSPALDLTFAADLPEAGAVSAQVSGPVALTGTLRDTAEGLALVSEVRGPFESKGVVDGVLSPAVDLGFDLDLPSLAPVVADLDQPLALKGRLRQNAEGFEVDTQLAEPYRATGRVAGQVTPAVDARFDVALPDLSPLVPQLQGPLDLTGRLRQSDLGFFVDTAATGPSGLRAQVEGLATGPDMSLTFAASAPNVAPFVPGVNGAFDAKGVLRQSPEGLRIDTNATGPYASRVRVEGLATGPNAAFDFNVALPNLGAVVDQLRGPLEVSGSARKQGAAWRLDTNANGPSGTQATVAGLVNPDGQLDLGIIGSAPLGLAEPFLKPRSLSGLARFDLALRGAPALSALSGQITARGARFSAPNLRLALQELGFDVNLRDSTAQIDLNANAVGGGRVSLRGPVGLEGDLPADLALNLQGLVLSDPRLYRTSVDGDLRVRGSLTGGAVIAGQVNVGQTDVSVPSTGITSIGEIPLITHIRPPSKVSATRRRAGLSDTPDSGGGDSQGGGYGLDLTVSAPRRIFVRGRGLDAELGGALSLGGTTGQVISAGEFALIRGRLDILGKRFDLVEGSARFEGDLVPYIRFVSSTTTSAGEINIVVEGPADAPEVSFLSNPEAPQDEVLAQLLFGRNISEISAFQALQLASAVATLAGRGGTGVVARLREGFGLDDLDITTTDDGATAVRAGKYISDNVYTDVTAASDGTGEVSLNLDLTPNLTAKGTLGSNGDTGIGLFFEKDY